MRMNDYNAFLVKAAAFGFAYEKRDKVPTMEEIKDAQDKILTTFETFKEKNDQRLKEIEAKGASDPLLNEQIEKITEEIKGLKEIRDQIDKLKLKMARPGGSGEGKDGTPDELEHRDAFLNYLRSPDDQRAQAALLDAEKKAVTTTVTTAGGFAVPTVISRRIERELAEISPLRRMVDVQSVGSKDFKILVDTRGAAYGWVGETDTRTETATAGLQEVAPTFGMLYGYPKASEESLDDIFFNVENWIVDSMLESFAEGEENAIVNGDGVKKPTGFLAGTPTAQADGVRAFGTLEYFPTGVAADFAANDKGDEFLDLLYKLKKGYRRNANWLMNKATAGKIMKFKDGQGNYLWQPSATAGQPDKFLGYSVAESEEMPDVAADAFPVAFGDFKAGYVLADLVGFRLTRDEITTPGYVKFYGRKRMGGIVKKSEAIKLLKVALT